MIAAILRLEKNILRNSLRFGQHQAKSSCDGENTSGWDPHGWTASLERNHKCTSALTWWRHQMETFSSLLALCAGNSPVPGEFPSQRPVTRSFDGFFICIWTNVWVNNRDPGDLGRHRAYYDVTVTKLALILNATEIYKPSLGWFIFLRKHEYSTWISYHDSALKFHSLLKFNLQNDIKSS